MKDILCIGETLLRLTPTNNLTIKNANNFNLNVGGSELNVALNMSRMGDQSSILTALPNTSIGANVVNYLCSYKLDIANVIFGSGRLGIYYFEPKLAMKTGDVIFDRQNTVFSNLDETHFNVNINEFKMIHTSGIMFGTNPYNFVKYLKNKLVKKDHDVLFSLDCNFRAKQWSAKDCFANLNQVLEFATILFANAWDLSHFLDKEVLLKKIGDLDFFKSLCLEITKKYPNLKYIVFSNRYHSDQNYFDFQGHVFFEGELFSSSKLRVNEVIDRIGCGDAFVAGFLHGILKKWKIQNVIDYASISSWLKHAIVGDTNIFTEQEILSYLSYDKNQIVNR